MKERQAASRSKAKRRPAATGRVAPDRSAAEAEAALRATEERLRLAVEALSGFVYDTDLSTGRVQSFSGVENVLGIDPGEPPQDLKWWQARVHPDDIARVTATWLALLERNDRSYALEFRIRHEDGHYVDVLDRGRILRDAGGRALRIVGSSTDISDRRRLEREREKLLADVQWERSRLREIFDAAPSLFALTRGPNHVFEYVNEAYYRFAGRRDLLGREVYDVFPEGRTQPFVAIRERVLREGITFEGKEMPLSRAKADGTREHLYLDLTFLPFVEPDGTRSGIILHGMDITSHVLARREIEMLLADITGLSNQERQSRLRAEKAAQARDEMLRVVSHELGGPLSVIS